MSAVHGELERALTRLGADVAFPETPELAAAVAGRLAEPAPRRSVPRRRTLAVVLVALAVGVGAAMAVPAARTAILDFFGLRGATVTLVETLPEVSAPSVTALELGRPVRLGEVSWPVVLVPADPGPPAAVYLSDAVPGGRLTLVWKPGPGLPRSQETDVGLLVTELRGEIPRPYVQKFVQGGTLVRRLRPGGKRAIWLEGGPHVVVFQSEEGSFVEDVSRLAGNTLLVEQDGLLVRIEGEIGLERALEIARSLEPS
jgi:hypothetical protein